MQVRYCEGWLASLLGSQPWVQQVNRWSTGGGPKPVGLTINGTTQVQLVRGAPTTPTVGEQPDDWDDADIGGITEVQAPAGKADWDRAIAELVTAAAHPLVKEAQTYGQWGKTTKPLGVRIAFVDGAEVFASFIDAGR